MRLLVPGILLGVSLTLGAAIAYESFAPADPVVVETPRPPAHHAPAAPPPVYAPPPIELYADIDARPPFSAARTPLQDPAAAGAAGAASDFVLSGVIIGGARAVALLRNRTTSATTSAVVGDLVNGWRVAQIDATSVTLKSNGGTFTVPLDGPANRPPSAPLPGTPQQPSPPLPAAAPQQPMPMPAPAAKPPGQPAANPPSPAVNTAAKPGLPAHPVDGTINPEALKGAFIDPTTGQPTL
ncbi:MAG TPA: hypothetical protein VHZ78_10055 [Rhizomicrobium sp.]|jgi:hypothetical protein|nr:hypothetical protein [Rhizomicrobium sp.]